MRALLLASVRRIVSALPLNCEGAAANARLADVLTRPARPSGRAQRVRVAGVLQLQSHRRELIARRRSNSVKLGLALHIGFARRSRRPLNSVRAAPPVLLPPPWPRAQHRRARPGFAARAYARGRTLFDHQQRACECLGFQWMTEHQRRALVRVLRDEVAHCADRERLLVLARQWLYDHRLLIVHERVIRAMVAARLAISSRLNPKRCARP
jgi:hypothetical protein